MRNLIGLLVLALAHVASSGNVAVRMPYGSPAGVTYVDGAYHAGLSAGPVAYAAPAASLSLAAAPVAASTYAAAPLAASTYAAAPVAASTYAAAPVAASAYAAVPTVQHVPGVADIPVTRYEAQPGVIQKVVDVAKPAVQTRRYEIRRPAIEKQFYDVEERVVVRPAGSAVVELDEPVSRTQKGPAVIQPAAVAVPTYGISVTPSPIAPAGIAAIQGTQILGNPGISSTPAPAPAPIFEQDQSQQAFSDEDSVSIENPDLSLRSALTRSGGPSTPAPYPRYERPEPLPSPARGQFQVRSQPQARLFASQQTSGNAQAYQASQARAYEASQARAYEASQARLFEASQAYAQSRSADARASTAPRTFEQPAGAAPAPQAYSTSQTFGPAPYASYPAPQALAPQARFAEATIPSARDYQGPEVSQANQQRFIDLFTSRGGVTEIGYARSAGSISSVGESGQVRGRVISATPAPAYSQPADERVNTRRVVVSRPIETLQEVEVAEPVTKFERVQVNQPTLFKTARQDLVRVPTSVPVYGKALAPVAPVASLAYSAPHQPWE